SGNIMCLDVLRVLAKQPETMALLLDEYAEVKGQDRHFDRHWRQLQQKLHKPSEAQGREISGQLYLFGVGAQMLRYASPPVSQGWCRMMLDPRGGAMLSEQVISEVLGRATGGGR
ncbi:MAG: isovaleryl-CoA dehydrogenase, partial [Kluyvera intermedia]